MSSATSTMSSIPAFASSRKHYKDATNYVATWLVETAKLIGYTLPSGNSGSPTKRMNGLEPQRMQVKGSPEKLKPPRKIIVKTKYFITLAQKIATAAQVDVPSSLISTLKDAISIRERTNVYQRATNPIDLESHNSHSYIIGVLRSVLSILEPRMKCHGKDNTGTHKLET